MINTGVCKITPTKYRDEHIPMIFENWRLWMIVIVASNVIMWGPVLMSAMNLTLGYWVTGYTDPAIVPPS
jgi:hypothetical protein